MHSTHVGELPLPNLPAEAQTVHLYPNMGQDLLAIPLLCDHGCQAIFDADWLLVKNKSTGRTVLTGLCEKETRLCLVDLANHSKLLNVTLTVATDHAPPSLTSNSATAVAQPITLMANSALSHETMQERNSFRHRLMGKS